MDERLLSGTPELLQHEGMNKRHLQWEKAAVISLADTMRKGTTCLPE
jgi:hypothetical protein